MSAMACLISTRLELPVGGYRVRFTVGDGKLGLEVVEKDGDVYTPAMILRMRKKLGFLFRFRAFKMVQ